MARGIISRQGRRARWRPSRRYGALGAISAATLLALGAATPARAAYTVDVEAPRAIRSLLRQHLDLARFAKRNDISDEQFQFLVGAAPQQALALVETEGYFSPVIRTDLRHSGKRKTVTIHVDPGLRTLVSAVDLEFKGPVLAEEPAQETAARQAFSLETGQPFTQSDWAAAKNAALKALQSRRYLGARIAASQARIDPRHRTAQLTVSFDSGPTFTLGALDVDGLNRYPSKIVHNVNPIGVGEIYSAARVQELQRQIQNTPYFASVAVNVDADPSKPNQTPIHAKVSEFPYNSIRNGIGYSSDTGAHIQSQYTYLNMFDRAWALQVQGRLEQNQQYGSITLSMPPGARAWTNSGLASYTRTNVEDTDIYSFRVGAQRSRTSQNIDTTYSLLFYEDRLSQNVGPPSVSRALVPSWSWTRRNVDDPLFPRSGNLLSVETGFAVKGILTDQTFGRVFAHGQQYLPIGKTDLFVLRAQLGGVFTSGGSSGIPASLLFRAGGAETIRGYSYDSIGNNVSGSVLPTKYMVTGGIEYQHWFSHDWGGALFYDVGTATDAWAEKTFFQGVGFGVRWRSPVGPVNLDLAYGLNNHGIRPYLTLGIAF